MLWGNGSRRPLGAAMDRPGRPVVAVVDQHEFFTQCLVIALEARGYVCRRVPLSVEAGRPSRVWSRLASVRPDVALINAELGRRCGSAPLVAAASQAGVSVVVLTDITDERHWGEYLAAGAQIVVPKTESLGSMVSTVRKVSHGKPVLALSERARLIALGRDCRSGDQAVLRRLERLSKQERAVLR